MEDREKEDDVKEEGQVEPLWAAGTKKKKRRHGQKVEKPEAFMANFFKGMEVYQTKLLVRPPSGGSIGPGRLLVSYAPSPCSFLLFFSSHLFACSLCIGGKEKGVSQKTLQPSTPLPSGCLRRATGMQRSFQGLALP
jgi:hypothetical protein